MSNQFVSNSAKPGRVPLRVTEAMNRAMDAKDLQHLAVGARLVLREIVRCVNGRCGADPVWIGLDRIAERLQCSRSTIKRRYGELLDAGIIERLEQTRHARSGRLGNGLTVLSAQACAILHLPWIPNAIPDTAPKPKKADPGPRPKDQLSAAVDKSPRGAAVSHGNITRASPDQYGSVQEKQSREPLAMIRIGERRLPRDLHWLLLIGGLRLPQIFRLMGQASQRGHRLSQIFQARRERIITLRGKDLYAYLLTLIRSPSSFASPDTSPPVPVAPDPVLQAARRDLAGRRFVDQAGRVFEISNTQNAIVAIYANASSHVPIACHPLHHAFVNAVQQQRLKALP